MSKQALEAGLKAYPENIISTIQTPLDKNVPVDANVGKRIYFMEGYKQAEKDIISIIESRLAELLGDAQPTPILRYELWDLIKKIKEEEK